MTCMLPAARETQSTTNPLCIQRLMILPPRYHTHTHTR
jgi:hypothetical protein